jgi:hypothetical protein
MNKGREQMTDNPAAEARAAAAATYERAAEELDAAAAHLRHTARLFREGEVPRSRAARLRRLWAHPHRADADRRERDRAGLEGTALIGPKSVETDRCVAPARA